MLTITRDKPGKYWARHVTGTDLSLRGAYALVGEFLPQAGNGKFMGKYPDHSIIAVGVANWCILVKCLDGVSDSKGSISIEGAKVIWVGDSKKEDELISQAAEWGATNDQLRLAGNPNYCAALYLSLRYEREPRHLPEVGVSLRYADNVLLISSNDLHTLLAVDIDRINGYHDKFKQILLDQAEILDGLARAYRVMAGEL